MTKISIIVAVTDNYAIGRNNDMLFHLPADLRRFKQLTMGLPVIMGRNTFLSLPKGALPGRHNIVITRSPHFTAPNIETVPSLDMAIAAVADAPAAYIIGGAQVYADAIALADELQITRIHATVNDADTFFPAIDPDLWQEVPLTDDPTPAPDDDDPRYTFHRYIRRLSNR